MFTYNVYALKRSSGQLLADGLSPVFSGTYEIVGTITIEDTIEVARVDGKLAIWRPGFGDRERFGAFVICENQKIWCGRSQPADAPDTEIIIVELGQTD